MYCLFFIESVALNNSVINYTYVYDISYFYENQHIFIYQLELNSSYVVLFSSLFNCRCIVKNLLDESGLIALKKYARTPLRKLFY